MSVLYMMCGIPACGKSTLAQRISKQNPHIKWVSRDVVRFSLITEDDAYFAREDEVYLSFVWQINSYLEEGYDVIADATHLNKYSRQKLLTAISEVDSIVAIDINIPLEIAKSRNAARSGRAKVPEDVLERMFKDYRSPSLKEGFDYIISLQGDKING